MSARLAIADLQPVADLIDRLQNVQTAIRDLHTAFEEGVEYGVAITQRGHGKDIPVAHTHTLSYWVVLQGLAAMERELLQQLASKDIQIDSALPMQEA
jgi:mannose-6-phosphate isomerase-like protein (cupin superfamily)